MASKAIGFLNFKFGADLGGFDRAMKKAQKNLKRFGKDIQKTGKTLTTNLTLPILGFAAASLKAFDEQQKAIAQVEAGIESTGMAAGLTSEQLQKMAADLQKISLFGDEQILSDVTAQLLTFTGIADKEFERAQLAALNLSTRLKTDLKSSSILLGKALNDPVGQLNALSRNGVRFTDVQKDMIKTMVEAGNVAGAQNLILDELSVQFGGAAENAREAGLGGVEGLKNKFMDLTEQIGARLLPVVTKFAKFMVELLEKFDKLDEGTKDTIVTLGLVLAAIGPILIFVGKLSVGLAAASKAFGALNLVMKGNPLLLVASIIATVVAALVYFYNTNIKVRASIKGLFEAAKVYFKGIAELVFKVFSGVGNLIVGIFLFDINRIKEGFKKSKNAIAQYGTDVGSVFTDAFNKEMSKDLGENIEEELKLDTSFLQTKSIATGATKPSGGKKKVQALSLATITPELELPKVDPQFSLAHAFDVPETVFEKIDRLIGKTNELNELGSYSKQIWMESMQAMGSELSGGAQSMQEFGNIVKGVLKDTIGGLISKGVAAAVSNALENPAIKINPAFIPVVAGVAAGLARTAFNSLIPEFAKGGLVTGPTVGLIGEGIGTTASNPEVIAPLDKLKQFIGGGAQNVVVEGVIKGNDIFLSNRNTGYNRQRSV